jgi:hypothetical protein
MVIGSTTSAYREAEFLERQPSIGELAAAEVMGIARA